MLKVIFTLDYEIHGNGEGCPQALMVEPTRRLMDLFERYGVKLTIMADVAEILKFRQYKQEHGRDDYHYDLIADQLRAAIRRGHDVQLHLHASYFNAHFEQGRWRQDWSEYNFAGLSLERLKQLVKVGKDYLENLLRPVDASYSCQVFRAANWAVSPSRNVVQALVDNGIRIDTSVFKHGRRTGLVSFDYGNAFSSLVPWPAATDDICQSDQHSRLFEFPIYSELRWLGAFLTPQRVYRGLVSRAHRLSNGASPAGNGAVSYGVPARRGRLSWLKRRYPWKADLNQCSSAQLIRAMQRAERAHDYGARPLPFTLIGHSKLFTRFNQWTLEPFLSYVATRPERFRFGGFQDFDLEHLAPMSAAACLAQ